MTEVDPFGVFRTALFVALAVYTVLTAAGTIWQVVTALRGSDPRKRLLRLYLSNQLATIRLRPLSGELAQITLWVAALLCLWWLHSKV